MHRKIEIRPVHPSDEPAVIQLWTACNLITPLNDPSRDIQRKLAQQPELFLVAVDSNKRIVGTVMAGYEGHRGWINYLAVYPEKRRLGIGRRMMEEAQKRLRALGCPKINLQVRSSNTAVINFYRQLGYTVDDVASMGKRLEMDGGA
jgi:ribosomal protein S18 acetylase RimI-like enzyme